MSPAAAIRLLAADESVALILVNDIPAGQPDGDYGRSQLEATAETGPAPAGTVFLGAGTGGVDAVIGTSGGRAAVFGQYLVGDILVSAVKSQAVSDPLQRHPADPGRHHRVPNRRDRHGHGRGAQRRVQRSNSGEHDLRQRTACA